MHMEFLHRNFLEDRERERRIILWLFLGRQFERMADVCMVVGQDWVQV
jgi:hypothetical protein